MAARTRDHILARARYVLTQAEKPTVARFAEAAGVSRASFYRAFESRGAPPPHPGAAALRSVVLPPKAAGRGATLYRLFPGKAALFTSLIKAFSPLEPVSHLVS